MINIWILQAMGWLEAYFIDGMCVLLAVLALQWYIRFDILSLGGVYRSLAGINSKIEPMNAYGPDNAKKINMLFSFKTHHAVHDAWTVYYGAFNQVAGGASRPDVRDHFNIDGLVTIPAARRKADAVPATLTVIGALGSFLYMMFAASGEGFSAGDGQLTGLLLSASSIFIVAVILSVVFQMADRSLYQGTVRKIHEFTNLINQKMPLPAVVQAKEETGKKRISEPVEQMLDLFVTKLDGVMQTQYENMAGKTKEVVAFQEKSQKVLAEVTEGMVASNGQQQILNQTMQEVIGSLSAQSGKVAASQAQIAQSLEKTESFIQMLTGILEANKEINETLNQQREALQKDSREYFEKTNQHAQHVSDDLNDRIEAVFTRFGELTAATLDKLETTMNKPLETLSVHMDEMMRTMEEQVRSISLYSKELSVEIKELNKSLGHSVKEFSGQLDGGVKDTLGVFDKGLGEISERFSTIMEDIKETADELSEAAGRSPKKANKTEEKS
ncbi:MAG: hypothetical protein R6W96_08360 [Clostridia bacterium]